MGEEDTYKTYRGRTCIVPLDVTDPKAVERLEEEVEEVVGDIAEDEEVFVSPRAGGDAVEVRVLKTTTE